MPSFLVLVSILIAPAQPGGVTRQLGPTMQEMVETVGSEVDAAEMVSEAIEFFVRPSSVPKAVVVIAAQLPEAWLPVIAGVQFVRSGDDAVRSRVAACGTYLRVAIKREVDRFAVTISEQNDCKSAGVILPFKRTGTGWHRDESVGVTGFGGGSSRCCS